MTKYELKNLLFKEDVKPDSYSLEGDTPNEAYCLNRHGNIWEVYYSERGNKTGLKEFNSEDAACKHLYELLRVQKHVPQ